MDHSHPGPSIDRRVDVLERRVKSLRCWAIAATAAACALPLLAALQDPVPDVLRTRGLVVVDDQGRDRILIGAPLPQSASRVRTDFEKVKAAWGKRYPDMEWFKKLQHQTNGIVILDENGHDRIAIGDPAPDPNIGRRIAPSTGIAINDPDGFERAGWGYFPKLGRVVLGLDHPGGEGLTLFLREDGAAGMRIEDEKGERRAFLGHAAAGHFGTPEAISGLLLLDGKGPRVVIDAAGDTPQIDLRDAAGASLQKLPGK
jgi:hypothetical protein